MIPAMITSSLMAFNTISGSTGNDYQLLNIVFMGLGQFGYILTIPIPLVASAVYYYSLKETKDAVSLNEQIDRIGTAETVVKKEDEGSY